MSYLDSKSKRLQEGPGTALPKAVEQMEMSLERRSTGRFLERLHRLQLGFSQR